MAIEKLLTGNIGSQVKELMATEDIMLEAVRDLVKDEIPKGFDIILIRDVFIHLKKRNFALILDTLIILHVQ